jgi:hypothetical protein
MQTAPEISSKEGVNEKHQVYYPPQDYERMSAHMDTVGITRSGVLLAASMSADNKRSVLGKEDHCE